MRQTFENQYILLANEKGDTVNMDDLKRFTNRELLNKINDHLTFFNCVTYKEEEIAQIAFLLGEYKGNYAPVQPMQPAQVHTTAKVIVQTSTGQLKEKRISKRFLSSSHKYDIVIANS